MHVCQMNCGGDKPGIWSPVMTFYAIAGTVGAPAVLGIRVCDNCRDTSTIDNFLTDEGFAMIASGFERVGKMRPRRELTTLGWNLVEGSEHPFDGTPFAGMK